MKLSRRGKHTRRGRHTKRAGKHYTRRIKHRGKQYKKTYRKNNRKNKKRIRCRNHNGGTSELELEDITTSTEIHTKDVDLRYTKDAPFTFYISNKFKISVKRTKDDYTRYEVTLTRLDRQPNIVFKIFIEPVRDNNFNAVLAENPTTPLAQQKQIEFKIKYHKKKSGEDTSQEITEKYKRFESITPQLSNIVSNGLNEAYTFKSDFFIVNIIDAIQNDIKSAIRSRPIE